MHIIRYKKDLRVQDHQPLINAICSKEYIIAIYIREPSIMNANDFSEFHQYWIQESLSDLKKQLNTLSIPLLIRYGEVIDIFDYINNTLSISQVHAHEETGNNISFIRDKKISKRFMNNNIIFNETPSNGVVRRLSSRDNWSKERDKRIVRTPILQVSVNNNFIENQKGNYKTTLILNNKAQELMQVYQVIYKPTTWIHSHDIPGEIQGHQILKDFLFERGREYSFSLSSPSKSIQGSSRLSAYITYGNLSQKQVYQACISRIAQLKTYQNQNIPEEKKKRLIYRLRSLRACLSRIHWRCHFIQKLESWPEIEYENQNSEFNDIRKDIDQDVINLWYYGKTGIPLVDAGMRCLHATGWINFRMRAMLVSFICNTCLQPWQAIGPMLGKLFVDYEPGIHYSQLQMQAGTTGINTIRIYNPLKQQEEKDSDLRFIRHRVPEYNTIDYPRPMIDVIQANRSARQILWSIHKLDETKKEAQKVFNKIGSRKKSNTKKEKSQKQTPQKGLFDI